jgi:ATP-binding cassette, subfamily C, bacterial
MTIFDQKTLGFVSYSLKAYPGRTAAMVALLILSGLAEGVGILALLPVLALVLDDSATSTSGLAEAVHTFLAWFNLPPTLGVLLGLMVLGMILKSGFLLLAMRQVGYTVAHVGTDLRLMFLQTVLQARWGYFTSRPVGHFSNSIGMEAHRASVGYKEICLLFAGIIQTLIYVGIALALSWQIAVIALIAGIAVMALLSKLVEVSRGAGQIQTRLRKALLARLTDAIHGIKPIKAMAREADLWPLLKKDTLGLNRAQQTQVLAGELLKAVHEPVLVMLLAIGIFVLLSRGDMAFAQLVVLAVVFQRLMGRVNALQSHYQSLANAESAFWSLHDDVEQARAEREQLTGTLAPPPVATGIRLDGVDFSYGPKPVLRQVSLAIRAGEITALLGPSGAGKTTIADLILGLYPPDRGSITIDDIPLSEIDIRAWRRNIGYVPQEMFLFHDSVLRNVTLGDETIGRDAVRRALVAAGAWEFVSQLPEGLDTTVGERGSKLSGGQRQRIAIARALVHEPALLILDEVTSALDTQTEAAICSTLSDLRGSVTIMAISHQPALMSIADEVYRLDDGAVRIIQREEPPAGSAVVGALPSPSKG